MPEFTTTQEHYHLINAKFDQYLEALIKGNRKACQNIVLELKQIDVSIEALYESLFKRALYKVGELWEQDNISVATEHIATAVTEGLMNLLYVDILPKEQLDYKAIVCSSEGEQHQVGAKMVADIFEMYGWDSYFTGAGTPTEEILKLISEIEPDIVAISISVYMNMFSLEKMISKIREKKPNLAILLGGQALIHGEGDLNSKFKGIHIAKNLSELEEFITNWSAK